MPYRITIEKYMAAVSEYWVNVYWVSALDMPTALAKVTPLVNAEKALYGAGVTITKSRVDDGDPNTDVSTTVVHNIAGTRTGMTGDQLPLWVTARVDFSATDGGRPSRKYLRGVLWETETSMTTLIAGMSTLLANYGLAVVSEGVCDPQGFDLTVAAPFMSPQMRQLRRGSKKKVIPA